MLAIVLATVTVLLLAWLSVSRPALWLPLLNRQLPAGLEIIATQGLRPGISGIAWHRIELNWNGQRLRLERGHARWALQRLRPLEVRLLHVETEHLLAVQAPQDEASTPDWEPLPRFWETSWWPIVAGLSGHLQGFDLLNHAGETVLSGSLQWQPGAHTGEASLFVMDTELTIRWTPGLDSVATPGWTALWHSHGSPVGPLHAEGEAQLHWDGDQLAFQLQGQLEGEAIALVSTDALAVSAAGQLDLFNATDHLLVADWGLYGQYEGLQLPADWDCHGRAALHHTLSPAPRLDRCELTSALGSARLHGPIALDWQPLAARWEQPLELTITGPQIGATLAVESGICVLSDACDWSLQLTIEEGSRDGLTWGPGTVSAHLQRSPANGLNLTGLEAHLTRLRQDDLTVRDARASLPAMTVWQPEIQPWSNIQPRSDEEPSPNEDEEPGSGNSPWYIGRLDASAHIELEEADLALTVRGSLTDLHFATPLQWATQLDMALDSTWQQHDLPTFHLKQQWQQTEQNLQASGTLSTRTLDPLLEHQLTLASGGNSPFTGPFTAQFTGEIDSSVWPTETDITAGLQGVDGTLLPIRALHGDVRARIEGSWRDTRLHFDLKGQAERLAGVFGQYAFAGVELAPFQLSWNSGGLNTVDPLRWQMQAFNIGVVLADLEGQLALQQSRWHLADIRGTLLGGHFHLDALSAAEGGNLHLDKLDLAAAVALMNQPDIRVSGALQGHLPVALEGGKPVIRGGMLRNIGPGIIHYRPAPGSDFLRNNPQTALVGDVLDNFHYQRLEAGVTYHADGDLLLATRLEGRNPELEGSPPVHLNLNVEQNIPALMRSLRAGDDIGGWLERRINTR